MNRRTLLKAMSCGTLSVLGGHLGWRLSNAWRAGYEIPLSPASTPPERSAAAGSDRHLDPPADEGGAGLHQHQASEAAGEESVSYLEKIRDFDRPYADDFVVDPARLDLLVSTAKRLNRVQRVFGHGNFNLLGFDGMVKVSRRYSAIGEFPQTELDLLEEIFFTDATEYGFYGEKVLTEMTAAIPERDTHKIADTGHYLFRGEPQQKYEKMRQDLDGGIFLTSGIRAVAKQMQLFLDKAVTTDGNLSQASRSLAPPGYSYHAVGDFDIGKVGFGLDNFNESFAETDEYKRLVDLGYAEIRYTPTNPYGVRHEPWHIKMRA